MWKDNLEWVTYLNLLTVCAGRRGYSNFLIGQISFDRGDLSIWDFHFFFCFGKRFFQMKNGLAKAIPYKELFAELWVSVDTKDVFLSGTLSIHYSDDTSTYLAKTIRVLMKSKFASSHVGCLLNHCWFTIALRCAVMEMLWPIKHAKCLLEMCAKRAQWLCGVKGAIIGNQITFAC